MRIVLVALLFGILTSLAGFTINEFLAIVIPLAIGSAVGRTNMIDTRKKVYLSTISYFVGCVIVTSLAYIIFNPEPFSMMNYTNTYIDTILLGFTQIVLLYIIDLIFAFSYLFPCLIGHAKTYKPNVDKETRKSVDELKRGE